jgi:hypothetical protein
MSGKWSSCDPFHKQNSCSLWDRIFMCHQNFDGTWQTKVRRWFSCSLFEHILAYDDSLDHQMDYSPSQALSQVKNDPFVICKNYL